MNKKDSIKYLGWAVMPYLLVTIAVLLVVNLQPRDCETVKLTYYHCKQNCAVIFESGNTATVEDRTITGDLVCRDNVHQPYRLELSHGT